jgi:hypothetical protein
LLWLSPIVNLARKPKPRARIDLSSLPPEDAPTAAMAGFDNTISILFWRASA